MKKVVFYFLLFVLVISILTGCGGTGAGKGTDTKKGTDATANPTDEVTDPASEPGTNPSTDPVTQPNTEPITGPSTDVVTDPLTEAHVHTWDEGHLIAAASCKDTGSILYTCTSCLEKNTVVIPKTDDHQWTNGNVTIVPTEANVGKRRCTCSICNSVQELDISFTEYTSLVDEQKTLAQEFEIDSFGGSTVTTDFFVAAGVSKFQTPSVNPTVGQHPRVLFTAADIPGIKTALQSETNKAAATEFNNLVAAFTDGKLSAPTDHNGEVYNFDYTVLVQIQALAMDYAINGNEVNGYRAIYAMKNNILTLNIVNISSDQCREYGNTMYIAACVYDWCYNLLTEDDKLQLTSGIEHLICTGSNEAGAKMEVGFPPKGQGSVSGHGSERQILRDYLSYAIAVYDELPTWWEFVGGRYYNEYVPVRNEYYKAGMYPQGVSNYVRGRYVSDLWSAWLVKAMSGSIPFDSDDMMQVMRTVYSYELPNGTMFNGGDSGSAEVAFRSNYGTCALISSYLFNDATMRAQLVYYGHSYIYFEATNSFATPVENLICSSTGLEPAEDRHEDMPLVLYNGGWLGQIIARNSWDDEKTAVVLMKIGQRSTANHDHQDAGQFQIYYRSLLAGDSGCYAGYGSDNHKYYHQATIAHNSLLIYNPNLAKTNSGYYSGGQRVLSETSSLAGWLSDTYKTGTVTGYAYAYNDEALTSPKYAYIAGDLTPAYDAATASNVNRRMLTVYTGDESIPMIFVVFDNLTAKDASYKKTFLLHTVKEPTIDGNTVTVINGQGKLTLQNLVGGDSITKVGGVGQNFFINGSQLATKNNSTDGFWGRVEISPEIGSLNNRILNVMFVSDSNSTATMPATLVESDEITGAQMGNYAFLFINNSNRAMTEQNITLSGTDNITYYVSGLHAGTWTVSVGEQNVGDFTVSEESGMLTFTAPAGQLQLKPGSDIISEGQSQISYELNGGTLPTDAPSSYQEGTETVLPKPTRGEDAFKGWYTSADFDPANKITAIPSSATGTFTVYAAWYSVMVNEPYTTSKVNVVEAKKTVGNLYYSGSGKAGSSFVSSSTKDGDGYLIWTKGTADPSIKSNASLYSKIGEEKAVTFTVSLATDGVNPTFNANFRLRSDFGTKWVPNLFYVTADGKIKDNAQTEILTLTEEFTTFKVIFDFETGKIGTFKEDGTVLSVTTISVPQYAIDNGVTKMVEWLPHMTTNIFEFYAPTGSNGVILISGIKAVAGAEFTIPDPDPE